VKGIFNSRWGKTTVLDGLLRSVCVEYSVEWYVNRKFASPLFRHEFSTSADLYFYTNTIFDPPATYISKGSNVMGAKYELYVSGTNLTFNVRWTRKQ
jgi:hypothetical protein